MQSDIALTETFKVGENDMSETNEICPACGGKGESFCFVNARPQHYAGYRQCDICKGKGIVKGVHCELLQRARVFGTKLKEARIEARMTQREAAASLGIRLGDYSQITAARFRSDAITDPEFIRAFKVLETLKRMR